MRLARAVASALGLIQAADKVTVMTVGSERTSAARAAELAEYLEWHGISPATRTFDSESRHPVGAPLLKECADAGIDLLVMGAYTHSRLRRMIIGSATEFMLGAADLPVLMAH